MTVLCLLNLVFIFVDFCEDEDVLIRQGNPNLPNVQALSLQEINSADLEDLFLPSTGLDTDDLFMAAPLVLPAEMTKQPCDELLELDQGVAMEVSADHHGFVSETQTYDLPLNNSPISSFSPSASVVTSSSFPDVLCSPYLTSPAAQQTFTYPTPPPPAPVSVNIPDQLVAADNPPSLVPVSASRQNSELDLICTILGEDLAASSSQSTQPTTLTNSYSDSPLQLHDVHSLMINSPPQSVLSCDGSTFTDSRTDCDVMSLASSLPSPSPSWLCTGKNLDTERSNRGSQTERRLSPSCSPIAEPMQTSSDGTPSPFNRSRGSSSSEVGPEKDQFIKMPFYDFKKILDDPAVSERDKDDVKGIRRRGKNKVAAKVCRQRKLDLINGLQYEIDLLKGEKDKLLDRTKAEQQRLQWYKHRWSKLVANNGVSSSSNVIVS